MAFCLPKKCILLADVFDNIQNMCLKVYELDPTHFSAPGLAR